MEKTIEDAIANYYQLKKNYEDKMNAKKMKILKNPSLSIREKRQKFLQIKKRCIKCNKSGGTLFNIDNTILSATCGNVDEPCDLNIKINRGSFNNIILMNQNIIEDTETVQNDIIKTKLNLLFNYYDEEETVQLFEKLKKMLKQNTDILELTKSEFIKIIDNPTRKKELKDEMTEFYRLKERLYVLHKEYFDRQEPMLINDMAELYVSQIQPLATKIRNLQYKYCTVDKVGNTYKLIEEPYTYEELFIPDQDNEPEVISNVF